MDLSRPCGLGSVKDDRGSVYVLPSIKLIGSREELGWSELWQLGGARMEYSVEG